MNIQELYQEIVLDHSKRPRNFGPLEDATITIRGDNPSCGDEVEVSLKLGPEMIEEIRFTGQGCAICMASASMMTALVRRKPRTAALQRAQEFHEMLTAPDPRGEPPDELGEAAVLEAVRRFPQRVKCATLAWHALKQALSGAPAQSITAEGSES